MARLTFVFALLTIALPVAAAPALAPAPVKPGPAATQPPASPAKPAAPSTAPLPAPAAPPVSASKPSASAAAQADAPADPAEPDAKQTARFATLRAEKVNLRTGPSVDYPIQWVFVRKGLPVEILASFDTWRKIRDSEGTEGWVHQGMLSGRRAVLVAGTIRSLRHDPKADASLVAQLEPGVVARIVKCDPAWCEVKAQSYRGWVERAQVWGIEPGEVIQ